MIGRSGVSGALMQLNAQRNVKMAVEWPWRKRVVSSEEEAEVPPLMFTLEEEEVAPELRFTLEEEETEPGEPSDSLNWSEYVHRQPPPYEKGDKLLVPGPGGYPAQSAEVIDMQWSNQGWIVFFELLGQPGKVYHVPAVRTQPGVPTLRPKHRRVDIRTPRTMRRSNVRGGYENDS